MSLSAQTTPQEWISTLNKSLGEREVAEVEWIFSSRLEVEYLNEKYQLGLDEDDEYDTLAGFIIAKHGGIPQEGEQINVGDYMIKILRREQSRLDLVSLQRLDSK